VQINVETSRLMVDIPETMHRARFVPNANYDTEPSYCTKIL